MKKKLMMGLALVAALAFVSCKSSESSYKKAYEKEKAKEMARLSSAIQSLPPTPRTTVRNAFLS